MKRQKLAISLFEFLQRGNFGPFLPRRDCSPEDVIALFGRPDAIEVCAPGKVGDRYVEADVGCFPVIVRYGLIEFHFDSPTTLFTLYSDTFFFGVPTGGRLKLTDAALLRHAMPLDDFLRLAKSRGLEIQSIAPVSAPYAWEVRTGAGIVLHFEHDDPEQADSTATLRAFGGSHDFTSEH